MPCGRTASASHPVKTPVRRGPSYTAEWVSCAACAEVVIRRAHQFLPVPVLGRLPPARWFLSLAPHLAQVFEQAMDSDPQRPGSARIEGRQGSATARQRPGKVAFK